MSKSIVITGASKGMLSAHKRAQSPNVIGDRVYG
jgi:hypothetical protein